jgi:tetratricopeptide (TPR) repeat protein
MKLLTCLLIITLFSLASCQQSPITNPRDYAAYLQPTPNTQLQQINTELDFWHNKLEKAPDDIIARSKIAGLLTRRFAYSGHITEIHSADSLYRTANMLNHTTSSGTYRSLAANCITQHRFVQAQLYIDSALALGDDKYLTVLMEFDIAMELGNRYRARKALNSLADKNSFEYLIREAKYKDHVEGDLDTAIRLLEKAWHKIKDNHTPALYCWIKTNLGDLYGHANRYRDSYRCYLEVLAKDPHYYHALKGIAWLAFSHDKDVANARKIVTYLQQRHPVPDYELLLSQFAAAEQDSIRYKQYISRFMAVTNNSLYGGMYNKYLFSIEANELNNITRSLQLAQEEVANRPTPEAFSWLAWAYCRRGEVSKAMETARLFVANKCFEPDALFYLGKIYEAGGKKEMAREYLLAAKENAFELGPVMSGKINESLKALN